MKRSKALSDLERFTYGVFRPPRKMTVSEWADEKRFLSSEGSAEPGRWRTSRAPYQKEIMDAFTQPGIWQIVMMASAQVGKALDVETPIPTPNGFVKMREIAPGNRVYGADGKQCNVVAVSPIWEDRPCYEITFSDGSVIIADEKHLWTVQRESGNKIITETLTTKYISTTFKSRNGKRNTYAIPVCGALQNSCVDLPIPPYTLGYWLGDGNSYSAQITLSKDDAEIIDHLRSDGVEVVVRDKHDTTYNLMLDPYRSVKETGICNRGHKLIEVGATKKGLCAECARQYSKHFQYGLVMEPVIPSPPTMFKKLKKLGVLANKHIPDIYKSASIEQRIELLRGMMDSDGYIDKRGRCEITLKSEKLINDFRDVLSSIGLKSTISKKVATCSYKGKTIKRDSFRLGFMPYSNCRIFKLRRKADRLVSRTDGWRRTTETDRRRIINVRRTENRPTKCIMVDSPDHLFLAGKTMIPTHNSEIELNMMGCAIDNDPGPMLYVQPTEKTAEDYSKRRIAPMIAACPSLRNKVLKAKGRDSGNTILTKTFAGGSLAIIGSNSPADLASKPIRYIFLDEIDRFPASAGTEGDPIELAVKRTETFKANRKIVKTSTPTVKGASKIEDAFMLGTQEEWQTQCPHCGNFSYIRLEQIKFDDKEEFTDRNGDIDYIIHHVEWECPSCRRRIPEHECKRLPARWEAKNPKAIENGIRSFRLNAFMSPWSDWREIARQFLRVNKDPMKLQVFVNTVLGEVWEARTTNGLEEKLYNRREHYDAEVPEGVLLLTMGMDTQDNRLEYEVVGWDRHGQSWGINRGVIPGRPDAPGTWEEVDKLLDQEWKKANGAVLRVLATFIDSGGHFTTTIYKECAKRASKKIWPIKGEKGEGKPECRPMRENHGSGAKFMLGVDAGKEGIMYEATVQEPGPRYMHFPIEYTAGYDREYFKGLISERMVVHRQGGQGVIKWEQFYDRNEPLDCRNYARAAYRFFHWHFDELEKASNGEEEPMKVVTKTEEVKRKQRHIVSRGIRV